METFWPILLFGGLLFLMMRFGCGSHMRGHGSGHKNDAHAGGHGGCCGGGGKHARASTGNGQHQRTPPESDVDRVCGKTVSTDNAKSIFHDGLVYYFCSRECREMFEASPAQYVVRDKEEAPPPLEHRPVEGGGHG